MRRLLTGAVGNVRGPVAAVVLVACFLLPAAGWGQGSQSDAQAREKWMTGYLKMEEARKAEASQDYGVAHELYGEALTVFGAVRDAYPDWNPSLLSYRVTFCRERLNRLEMLVDQNKRSLPPKELLAAIERQTKAIDQLTREKAELESRQRLTAESLERARREAARNAAAGEQLDELAAANTRLQARVTGLEGQLVQAQQDVAALKEAAGLKEVADGLRRQLDLTTAKMAEAADALGRFKAEHDGLTAQLKKATLALAQTRLDNERLARREQEATEQLGARDEKIAAVTAQASAATVARDSATRQLAAAERVSTEQREAAEVLRRQLGDMREFRDKYVTAAATIKDRDQTIADLGLELEQARQRLQASAATDPQQLATMQALQKQAAALVAENAELKTRLGQGGADASDDRDLAKLSRLLSEQEKQTQAAEVQVKTVRKELEETAMALARAKVRAAAAEKAVADLRDGGVTGDGREQELTARLQELEKSATRAAALETELGVRLTTQKHQIVELIGQNEDLTTRVRDQLGMLKNQEDQIAALKANPGGAPEGDGPVERIAELGRQTDALRLALAQERDMVAELGREMADQETDAAIRRAAEEEKERKTVADLLRKAALHEQEQAREAAIWTYRRVLEHEPGNAVALQRLGVLALEDGDSDLAEQFLVRAFYADPDDLDVLIPLGFSLVRSEQPDLAISMLARAAALNKGNAAVHRSLGVACSSLGWRDAAESQFRRAMGLDDKDPESAFNLAILLATGEPPKMEEASMLYRRARELGMARDEQLDVYFGLTKADEQD